MRGLLRDLQGTSGMSSTENEPDVLAPKNADFQTKAYWDKRYAMEAPDAEFDWFRKVCCRAVN